MATVTPLTSDELMQFRIKDRVEEVRQLRAHYHRASEAEKLANAHYDRALQQKEEAYAVLRDAEQRLLDTIADEPPSSTPATPTTET
jgi:thiamine biosynthesis lipoprotein ApbE